MNASPDLIYSLVRDTSCFVVKKKQQGRSGMGKRGAEFTTEANNPAGKNGWKYSGLANAKTVDVTPTEGGVVLTTKSKDSKRVGKVRAIHRPYAAASDVEAAQRRKRAGKHMALVVVLLLLLWGGGSHCAARRHVCT